MYTASIRSLYIPRRHTHCARLAAIESWRCPSQRTEPNAAGRTSIRRAHPGKSRMCHASSPHIPHPAQPCDPYRRFAADLLRTCAPDRGRGHRCYSSYISYILGDIPGPVPFTFNTWTSKTGDSFLSITGPYIDSPPDSPDEWNLKSEQLAYTPIEREHLGPRSLYEIGDKAGRFTADNATTNDTALRAFGQESDPLEMRRVRCIEHAVHLTAGHFISDVSPLSGKAVLAKEKKLDDDELDALLGDNGSGHEDGDKERGDGEEDGPASKDALRKALVLVKQIRMSPQAQRFFKKKCAETGVPVIQLLGWIRTRGASMFTFLDHLILLRAAVNRFVHLADNHGEHIIKIHEVLQDLANTSRPRIHGGNLGANMAATENFEHMQDSINAGLENLEKWFGKTDNTDVYFRWIRPSKRLSLSDRALHKIDDYYVATTAEVVVAAAATSE
ncbi:hypothetical protein DFH06DRAFT_1142883 [Mycena polygramma]|nr:hypothetical protein DFH06DRAFT_1142883 [Mycena polygramma]